MHNRPAVEAAYQAAPDHVVAEILDGELFLLPRPRPLHSRVLGRVQRIIDGSFGDDASGPGGWVILPEPELHLGPRPDKLVPDVVGWRQDHLPESVFDDDAPAAIGIAPDWVCEVLSERTRGIDRVKKMRIYRREGVHHVWLVDPVLRTLEVFRLQRDRWTLADVLEGDVRVHVEPFGALELDLARFWIRRPTRARPRRSGKK
jgi:Uma2 family endonuclease